MFRVVFTLMLLFSFSVQAERMPATEYEIAKIQEFFDDYNIWGQSGFEAFAEKRKKMISSEAVTRVDGVEANGIIELYFGKQGHIQSLTDWFKIYRVESGFGHTVVGKDGTVVKVKMHGNLIKTVNGKEILIPEDKHNWVEYFYFNDDGEIAYFEATMNISGQ